MGKARGAAGAEDAVPAAFREKGSAACRRSREREERGKVLINVVIRRKRLCRWETERARRARGPVPAVVWVPARTPALRGNGWRRRAQF